MSVAGPDEIDERAKSCLFRVVDGVMQQRVIEYEEGLGLPDIASYADQVDIRFTAVDRHEAVQCPTGYPQRPEVS